MNRRFLDQLTRQTGGRHLAAAVLLALQPACQRDAAVPPVSTTPAEKQFPLTGVILKVDAAHKTLFVSHEAVAGYMPAMAMEFAVSPANAAAFKEGDSIRATLFPDGHRDGQKGPLLENIWLADAVADSIMDASDKRVAENLVLYGKHPYREIGEGMPDFALYNQEGQVVQTSRFHGRQVMLDFIYTRCPIATMCPASTAKMVEVQRQARAAGVTDLELVSITLDPEYDTPAVLKDYAKAKGIDLANFTFLTGREQAIKALLLEFGVEAEFEGSILKHTLTTLLIDRDGKISKREDGSQWTPEEFVRSMKKE